MQLKNTQTHLNLHVHVCLHTQRHCTQVYNNITYMYLYYDGDHLLEEVKELDVGRNTGGIGVMGIQGQAVNEGYHNSFDIDTFLELSTGLNHKEVMAAINK